MSFPVIHVAKKVQIYLLSSYLNSYKEGHLFKQKQSHKHVILYPSLLSFPATNELIISRKGIEGHKILLMRCRVSHEYVVVLPPEQKISR